jgi:hypothetical protein
MKPSDKIWLEPECDECDERCWSCVPFDDCEECGKETIGYVCDDIVLAFNAEASRMFARIEKLEAALEKIAQHDMQAIAMDALRPGERIRERNND